MRQRGRRDRYAPTRSGPGSDRPDGREDDALTSRPPAPQPHELTRVVALDGPAGSGKTTVARRVAAALGWRFVDTGATYRAVTAAVLRAGVDPTDTAAVVRTARATEVELSTDPGDAWVRLDGEDVTEEIRTPEVTANVSVVSAVPEVRALLIDRQRSAMGTQGAVVEGRDIATVVAPHAALKVYLDATPEERARRRAGELPAAQYADGVEVARLVHEALATRDAIDSQTNKLEPSDGAVHLDTTNLSLDQVVDVVVRLARESA